MCDKCVVEFCFIEYLVLIFKGVEVGVVNGGFIRSGVVVMMKYFILGILDFFVDIGVDMDV